MYLYCTLIDPLCTNILDEPFRIMDGVYNHMVHDLWYNVQWAIPFYTRTPPMDDKISQSGFVQGTNETFVRGFFLNIGMCPGVKIAMSRGCYTEKSVSKGFSE